jgi:tRNA pseudouridine32 synthase/23S rRNA pseudouridine746 synthase
MKLHVPFEHEILFEDDDLLVVDKNRTFLTMTPTGPIRSGNITGKDLKKQTGYAEALTPIHQT